MIMDDYGIEYMVFSSVGNDHLIIVWPCDAISDELVRIAPPMKGIHWIL